MAGGGDKRKQPQKKIPKLGKPNSGKSKSGKSKASASRPSTPEDQVNPELIDDSATLSQAVKAAKRKLDITDIAVPKQLSRAPKRSKKVSEDSPITDKDFILPQYKTLFNSLFKGRKVSHGHNYDLDSFPSMALIEFVKPWLAIICNSKNTYPNLVRLFFANMSVEDGTGIIRSTVRGTRISISPEILATTLGLTRTPCEELTFGGWNPNLDITSAQCASIVLEGVTVQEDEKISVARPPALSKLLLHMIDRNVIPNAGHHVHEPDWNLHAAARLVQKNAIDLSFLMYWIIRKVWSEPKIEQSNRSNTALPFGNMFTLLFEAYGIDLSNEKPVLHTKIYSLQDFKNTGWQLQEELIIYFNDFRGDARRYEDGIPMPCPPIAEIPGTKTYNLLHGLPYGLTSQAINPINPMITAPPIPAVASATIPSETGNVDPNILLRLSKLEEENKLLKQQIISSFSEHAKAIDNKLDEFYKILWRQTDDIKDMWNDHKRELEERDRNEREWKTKQEDVYRDYKTSLDDIVARLAEMKLHTTTNFGTFYGFLGEAKEAIVDVLKNKKKPNASPSAPSRRCVVEVLSDEE